VCYFFVTMVMIEMSRLTAIIDTNVSLDIYGCFDVSKLYDRLGEDGLDEPEAVFRRARARESLLLAIYLNKIKARTYGHIDEVMKILEARVPPSDLTAAETHYTTQFIHFVKDRVLPRWREWGEPGKYASLMKADADTFLLNQAKTNSIPLITNEGFGRDGLRVDDLKPDSLRLRASAAGVAVFTPREFWQGKINPKKEIDDFLDRFRRFAPKYAADHPDAPRVRNSLEFVHDYYRHVLLGETNTGRVRVSVA
jgi:hypothetical protein